MVILLLAFVFLHEGLNLTCDYTRPLGFLVAPIADSIRAWVMLGVAGALLGLKHRS